MIVIYLLPHVYLLITASTFTTGFCFFVSESPWAVREDNKPQIKINILMRKLKYYGKH
jgi:hypothetical protein